MKDEAINRTEKGPERRRGPAAHRGTATRGLPAASAVASGPAARPCPIRPLRAPQAATPPSARRPRPAPPRGPSPHRPGLPRQAQASARPPGPRRPLPPAPAPRMSPELPRHGGAAARPRARPHLRRRQPGPGSGRRSVRSAQRAAPAPRPRPRTARRHPLAAARTCPGRYWLLRPSVKCRPGAEPTARRGEGSGAGAGAGAAPQRGQRQGLEGPGSATRAISPGRLGASGTAGAAWPRVGCSCGKEPGGECASCGQLGSWRRRKASDAPCQGAWLGWKMEHGSRGPASCGQPPGSRASPRLRANVSRSLGTGTLPGHKPRECW